MTRKEKRPLSKRIQQIARKIGQTERPLDSAAGFSQLYKEKHLLVFRHIYGLSGGPTTLVEDLTAETFVRAWHARKKFSGDSGAATGWLLRIARNLVIDQRRNRVEQQTILMDEGLERLPGSGLPEDELIFAEQQAILIALLQELPPQKREMITLRYLLGWQVKEIASYFDMPENTVTVNIKRSLEQMRRRWPLVVIEKEKVDV